MLFIQLVLICVCGSTPMIHACAEWKIISPPIIFGETARLGCEIQNGTDGNTRTWQGGPGYTSIYFNGVSSNPDKYMEVTAREPYRSLLEIYNFSENDVDCDYSCSIGFHEDRHKLSLNPSDFELHPTKSSSAIAATLRKGHLVADVSLMKVYPEPKCLIKFQEKHYIGTTHSKKNGKFFQVHIKLDHTFETHICKGQLTISCIVGTSDVEVDSQYFHTCPDNLPETKNDNLPETKNDNLPERKNDNLPERKNDNLPERKNDHTAERNSSDRTLQYLPYIVTVLLFVIVLVVLFLGVVYIKKSKNPVICNYCNKGDGVAVDDLKQEGQGHNIELMQKNKPKENNGTFEEVSVIDDGNECEDRSSDMIKKNDAITNLI